MGEKESRRCIAPTIRVGPTLAPGELKAKDRWEKASAVARRRPSAASVDFKAMRAILAVWR